MQNYYLAEVLLIDDDSDDVELFSNALSEVSPLSRLRTFGDCQKAINAYDKKDLPPPEVIFLDLTLPGISGKECVKLLREITELSNVPIVALSSGYMDSVLDELYDLDVTYFISKPPSFGKLKAVIDKMVNTPHIFEQRTKENFFTNEHEL